MIPSRSELVHVSIAASPSDVQRYLADVTTWIEWAPWVRSVRQLSPREWQLDTESGPMTLRFVDLGSTGVLDHHVTLSSGLTVFNSMRLSAEGDYSDLTMHVTQLPNVTDDDFARDVAAVRADFARIKTAAERRFAHAPR